MNAKELMALVNGYAEACDDLGAGLFEQTEEQTAAKHSKAAAVYGQIQAEVQRLYGDNRVQQRGPEGNLEEYAPHVATGHEQRAKEDLVHMLRCLRLIHAAYDADGADLSAWPGRAAQSLERTLDALADEVETSNGLRLQVEALGAQVGLALACKNEAETRELQSEQEADELRALKCGEWFYNVHACAADVEKALRKCCEMCDDGDGHCIFPYYSVAPYTHDTSKGWIGSTRLVSRDQWGPNFREDTDCEGSVVYMRCPHCGRGEKPSA